MRCVYAIIGVALALANISIYFIIIYIFLEEKYEKIITGCDGAVVEFYIYF